MITFDGVSRLIIIDESASLTEIYSEWKRWAILNSNFPPAFRQLGGDPLGGGVSLGIYTFIRNDYGWRIKPKGTNGELIIDGNLFPQDLEVDWTIVPDESDYVFLRLRTSSLTQAIDSSVSEYVTVWTEDEKNTVLDNTEKSKVHSMTAAINSLKYSNC